MNRMVQVVIYACAVMVLLGCDDSDSKHSRYAERKPDPAPRRIDVTPPPAIVAAQQNPKLNIPNQIVREYKGDPLDEITRIPGKQILLVFCADWSLQCQRYLEEVKKYSGDNKTNTIVYVVNADKYEKLSVEFKIEAIPTTVLFVEGMRLRDFVGAVSSEKLAMLVVETLNVQPQ